jgi:NAD+ kinase
VANLSAKTGVSVLADGQRIGELSTGDSVTVRLADQRSLLATLPDATFFRRYRETFAS